MNTDSVKYNVALCAQDSVLMEKKQRWLNRDIRSENEIQLSLSHNKINRTDIEEAINYEKDTVQGPMSNDDKIELRKAWTMGMPMIDGNISTMDTEEQEQIEDNNKIVLYARAVHANHMIKHHMHEIFECQQVVNEYQSMADGGRKIILLESDQYKSDLVINQDIMRMIDTNIFWYGKTFRVILMELRKIRSGESITKSGEEPIVEETYCKNDSNTTFNDQGYTMGRKHNKNMKPPKVSVNKARRRKTGQENAYRWTK